MSDRAAFHSMMSHLCEAGFWAVATLKSKCCVEIGPGGTGNEGVLHGLVPRVEN